MNKLRMQRSDGLLWGLAALLVLSLAAFGAYYTYDRYVHEGETLLDRNARHLEQMVMQNPQNADVRVATAAYYLEGGLPDQAIAQLVEALKIDPNHQDAMLALGRAHTAQGNYKAALEQYNRVLELNRNNPMAHIDNRLEAVHYQVGAMYVKMGDYAQAVTALKSALAINRSDADALYLLGVAYQKQGDNANAVAALQSALRFVPDFPEAYQGLEAAYIGLGKTPEAAYARAMSAITQGNAAGGLEQLNAVLKQSPEMTQAYFGLGMAYEKLNRRDEARAAYQKFLTAYPNDIAAQQAFGRLSQGVKR